MLYILVMLILLLPTLTGWGLLLKKLTGIGEEGLAFNLIGGILLVSMCWTMWAFFYPLTVAVEVITVVVGVSTFFFGQQYLAYWTFILKNKWEFPVACFFLSFYGSYYPFILDHFGYYVPTIKWLTEVGLVQGISNLDLLLGQMSLWHVFQAGFSHVSDSFLRINILILVVYVIYVLEKKSWLHLLFIPVLLLFCQSPSTDLPVIVLSLIILDEVLRGNRNLNWLFLVSVFIFCIKPTMIWVPLVAGLYGIIVAKQKVLFVLPGVVVLTLFFLKNTYTFGYPIFPVASIDFGWPWKPNVQLMKNSSEMAIMKTYDMQFSFQEIVHFTWYEQLRNWLLLDGIKGQIHILFLLSLILFIITAIYRRSTLIWIVCGAVLFKSAMVLLFSAQYRFFFDVFFVIIFILFYKAYCKKCVLMLFCGLMIVTTAFLSFPAWVRPMVPSFRLSNYMSGFKASQLLVPAHYTYQKYKTHQIGNLKFNVVDGYVFSFETPLPAISPQFVQEDLDAGIFPQLKGKSLKEGFIWRKISEAEKKQVQSVLTDYHNGLRGSNK